VTVAELIEELRKFPVDAEVVHGTEENYPVTRPLAFDSNAHWWDPSDGARGGFHQGPAVVL
jgi:hypothetical protein